MVSRSESKRVRDALDAARRELSLRDDLPKILSESFELGEDRAEDPAVFLTVVLDDATNEADWVLEKLDPITKQFRAALEAADIDRWVYVRFVRPQDMKAAG